MRIYYSYLAGKKHKTSYYNYDHLYINYTDSSHDYFTVDNYCLNSYACSTDRDKVYSGKNTYAKPGIPDIGSSNYKISYLNSSRSAIGTYYYIVQANYPYFGSYYSYYRVIPKSPASLKATFYKTKCSLKWSKVTNCTGYKITFYKEDSDEEGDDGPYGKAVKSITVKSKSTTAKTVTIKRSSYDYIVIKSYKTVNNKRYYSNEKYKFR